MNPTWRNPQWLQGLEREGIVVAPLLNGATVASLASAYHALVPRPRTGFTATLLDADASVRLRAHQAVRAALGPLLATAAPGLRLVNGGFAVRSAGSLAQDMPWHQDWSFVDEQSVRSYGIWVPLVDVDADSGCLEVVAGSHASAHPLRAPGDAFGYPELMPLLQHHRRTLTMRAGEAAIFDQRLFHRSTAQRGAHDRIAAAAVLLPRHAALQQCRRGPGSQRSLVPVADDHYLLRPVALA